MNLPKLGPVRTRVLVSGRGQWAKYKDVDGPDGSRYAASKDERKLRMRARFAVGESDRDKQRMRNARKRERAVSR